MERSTELDESSAEGNKTTKAEGQLINSKKRPITQSELDDKKNRGNYRCSRCNLPKKGHVCPYQPVFRRRDQSQVDTIDISIQVEIDSEMTVAKLGPLSLQGTAESYLPISAIAALESQSHDSAI